MHIEHDRVRRSRKAEGDHVDDFFWQLRTRRTAEAITVVGRKERGFGTQKVRLLFGVYPFPKRKSDSFAIICIGQEVFSERAEKRPGDTNDKSARVHFA